MNRRNFFGAVAGACVAPVAAAAVPKSPPPASALLSGRAGGLMLHGVEWCPSLISAKVLMCDSAGNWKYVDYPKAAKD